VPAKPAKSTPATSKPAPSAGRTDLKRARTLANKKRRMAAHFARHPNATEGDPTQHRPRVSLPLQFVTFLSPVPQHRGSWFACILDGRILSCGSLGDATNAKKESTDPRAYLVRRDGSILNRIEA
jgi:hypothetical protein